MEMEVFYFQKEKKERKIKKKIERLTVKASTGKETWKS